MRQWRRLAAAGLALLCSAGAAAAQNFPSRQVTVLVPYAPGGGVDIVARTLGAELSKRWNQPVVIENRPGAGGSIASQVLVKSSPDGHTLIVVASGHAINPLIYPKLPYDTLTDFTPIAMLANSPNILVVRPDAPYKTLADLIAAARAKPGELAYGNAGTGTSTHLAGELLKHLTKIDIRAIPYKGGAPALNDLLGGHISLSFNNAPEALGHIKGGTVRALGVTPGKRSPLLPDVPTIAEGGVAGYDTGVWWGLLAPGGLPADVATKLHRDVAEAMQVPAVTERLTSLGATPDVSASPQAFDALIRSDLAKWKPIVAAAGIKGE